MNDPQVGIIGAGTMGAGIAQVAATHGWRVILVDRSPDIVAAAISGVGRRLDRLVEKGRLDGPARDAAAARLVPATGSSPWAECELVIEAVVEDLEVKRSVLGALVPKLGPGAIVATNTSSLSVGAIGEAIGRPARTAGMHFFNPAPLLALVEVIAGEHTAPEVVDRVAEIAQSWGKVVARAADVPGFIVNHVARPYYLEAFRLAEDGVADVATIDRVMTGIGFRMGPFALTDLIGQDVNTATTRSVWSQLDEPPLLAPSRLQEQLVADGHLGRKTGRGAYDHAGDHPVPVLEVTRRDVTLGPDDGAAIRAFAEAAARATNTTAPEGDAAGLVVTRILGALIVQAQRAAARGVAAPEDIDTALRYGVNYPMGPFAWSDAIGAEVCARGLEAVGRVVGDGRFDRADVPARG